MKYRRLLLHVLFWLVQYSISLYNELYLSASFSRHPSALLFLQAAASVGLVLLIKLAVTYYVLYRLVGRWISQAGKPALYIETVMVILLAVAGVRLLMQHVIWPLIYEESRPVLSGLQIIARYLYSLLDLMQVLGIAAAIKLFKLRLAAVKQQQQLKREKLRAELLHLKGQVNPHFLFNTLNSIFSLARAQSPAAPEAILQLSKILRFMLYETGQDTILLSEELAIIEDYIELQQLRYSRRLTARFEKNTDDAEARVAPLLLLPLVENAFKHGSVEGGIIDIRVSLKANALWLEIKNPMGQAPLKMKGEGESIGLANIRRQLELQYRQFSLQTTRLGNIFKTSLNIQLAPHAGNKLFDSGR